MEYCNGMMYAVKQGDTLYSISLKYGIPLVLLLHANPYVDVYNLQVGETICIPMRNKECHAFCGRDTEEEHNGRAREEDRSRDDGRDREDDHDRDDDYDREGDDDREDNRDDDQNRNDRDGEYTVRHGCCRAGMEMPGTETAGRRMAMGDAAVGRNDMPLSSEPENTMEGKETDNIGWQRYVSKPGDTLDTVMGVKCPQSLEEFLEQNPMDRIYLLPGIVYRCKRM